MFVDLWFLGSSPYGSSGPLDLMFNEQRLHFRLLPTLARMSCWSRRKIKDTLWSDRISNLYMTLGYQHINHCRKSLSFLFSSCIWLCFLVFMLSRKKEWVSKYRLKNHCLWKTEEQKVPLHAKDRNKLSTIECLSGFIPGCLVRQFYSFSWNEKVDWFRSLHVTIEEIVERDISWKIVVVDNIWRLTCVVVIVVEVLATKGLNDDEACTRLLEFLL